MSQSVKYMQWSKQLEQSLDGYTRYDAIAYYWLSIAITEIDNGLDKDIAKKRYSQLTLDDAIALNQHNDQLAVKVKPSKNHPSSARNAFGYKSPLQVKQLFLFHFNLCYP